MFHSFHVLHHRCEGIQPLVNFLNWHSDPERANFGKNYRISEKSNLIKTSMVIHDLNEDALRIKIKQKVDFSDF